MPREIINEIDVLRDPELKSQATLSWGWELDHGNCAALLGINFRADGMWQGTAVALEWGDLERLNKAVRRAMKHYRKSIVPSELPSPDAPEDECEAAHHSR